MPRLPVSDRRKVKRKKKPLPLGERLRRIRRELIDGWWFWLSLALYLGLMFAIAINPLVDPHMPSRGKLKILAVYPLSYHLLDGSAVDGIQFVLLWLPLVYFALRFPFWLKRQGEWEVQAAKRRIRDKERRARKRAEREAAKAAAAFLQSQVETKSPDPADGGRGAISRQD